ncbi:LacI family DNA-binding transcriptional regulator [Enterococcus sp.]|uniref:LacI family DNA-binding transcriptional regulator n=1 Tax=Enterococcus sp. TaxID=35783 RepID=UPI0028A60956|nr:LacI family DNA-binding transcriptional regulator [Enterococcus sp.]
MSPQNWYNKKKKRWQLMTTIKDIAEKAGVAKSTVSRYLNNGYISEEKRKKIDQIIAETGYRPNTLARSLKAQDSKLLGVIIPRLNSPSANDVLKGIDRTARQNGYQLLITNSDQSEARELENIQTLVKQKVAGMIIFAREMTPQLKEVLPTIPMPVILIGQRLAGVHAIVHQDYQAGKDMANYALTNGHRDFLFVGVSEKDEAVGSLRKHGFVDTVEKVAGTTLSYVETSFSRRETYQKARSFLPDRQATYVACATDNIAIAVLKAAHELGQKVPEDFSLNGFGGYDSTDYVYPTITTAAFPYTQLGVDAVHALQRIIQGETVPEIIELPNHLVIKQSTARLGE